MACLAMYEKKAITKCNMYYNVRQKCYYRAHNLLQSITKKNTQNVKRMAEKLLTRIAMWQKNVSQNAADSS